MMKREFRSLAELAGDGEKPMRVCIVTPDLLGPVKNGGIGTACGYLAFALADAGHDVSVLFCQTNSADIPSDWIEDYAKKNIAAFNAASLADADAEIFPNLASLGMARAVYNWLAQQPPFDLVLFMDWGGAGFYAMHAKATGLNFHNTALAVVIHSPTYWHTTNNAAIAADPLQAVIWHMERQAVLMADAVISPSRYMLGWCEERFGKLPELAYWQPNLLEWNMPLAHDDDSPVSELVFFGRLEFRKGLEQFCTALDRLAEWGKLPAKVTFLGKCSWMGDEHSALYIGRRSRKWQGCEISMQTQMDHGQAVSYICGPGRMAVMPSIADNSPYTVYECLLAHVPFLARNVGGISEFLPESEHERFLFDDNPTHLARKLEAALGKPPARATLAIDMAQNARAWREGLPRLARKITSQETEQPELPFISVILTHYNRPALLRQAVASLYAQNYDNFEVILADDGSTDAEAIAYLNELEPEFGKRGWRILRLENAFAPAARNRGVEQARGDWLLFFDDDNVAKPHMLKTCAVAAATRKRGFIPIMFQVFEGQDAPDADNMREIFLPTATALPYGVLHNTMADTTALVHKDTFNAVGGFREDYGIGHEDFELFLRFGLTGQPAAIIPEALFWYRKSPDKTSVQLNTNAALNRMRSLRPFLELLPPPLAELALMTHSMGHALRQFPENNNPYLADLPIDRAAEPDTEESMMQAADILSSQGLDLLGAQILASLPSAGPEIQGQLLAVKAGAAARQGDFTAIDEYERQFDALDVPEAAYSRFAEAVMHNMASPKQELRARMLKRLAGITNPDALTCLLLAEDDASRGDMAAAAINMAKAIELADIAYREGRPDVKDAVKAKTFFCGLQHFRHHGFADRTPWPHRALFQAIFRNYPNLQAQAAVNHMRLHGYNDRNAADELIGSLSASPAELARKN